ncbi:hypothetical protein ACNF49_31845 [Actinomadura sp. ATCC 39365]
MRLERMRLADVRAELDAARAEAALLRERAVAAELAQRALEPEPSATPAD